ncbi:MAG: glycosyltransferase family 4 protein [Acidobacteriota bacterium]
MSCDGLRLGFVGPHLARHAGWVTTQSEVVSSLFARDGVEVRTVSSLRPPLARAADTALRLLGWRGRVDVVILSVFGGAALRLAEMSSAVARTLALPQIHWLHGGGLADLCREQPARLRRLFARSQAVVAPSDWLADAARALDDGGPIAARVSTIPNVLDLEALEHRPRTVDPTAPRLLWMRAFHEIYAPQLAIDVLSRLRADGLDARLTLAGQDKGLEATCRQRVAAAGLEASADFPGFLDPAAKRRHFASHDVFLNTNRIDNTPVSVLEAMAAGLPVVATAVGGVPHLLEHGRLGVLVEPDDPQAMAAAVRGLCEHPADTLHRVEAARARAEASAWPRVREAWCRLARQVAAADSPVVSIDR